MTDNPREWLGRGYENVPGEKFGWAWHRERDAIRAHLAQRWHAELHTMEWAKREFRVTAIQQRLHKYKPTFAQRQAAWLAKQPQRKPKAGPFTAEELAMIAEHFAYANDPIGQSIHAKATEQTA